MPPAAPDNRGSSAHGTYAVPCGARTVSVPGSQPYSPCSAEVSGSSGPVAHPVWVTRAPAGAPATRCTRSSYGPLATVTLSTRNPGTIGAPAANTGRCQDAAQPQPSPPPAPSGWIRRRTLDRPFTSTDRWLSATFSRAVGPVRVE